MAHGRRWTVGFVGAALTASLLGLAAGSPAQAAEPTASASAAITAKADDPFGDNWWVKGIQANSTRTVCLPGPNYTVLCTPYQYSWHRIDFQADLVNNVPPAVGEVFYVRLFTAQVFDNTTGDKTDGYWPALTLPAGVSLAISSQAPVVCRYAPKPPDGQPTTWQFVTDTTSCRPSPVPGANGGVEFGYKIIGPGEGYEVYVPVVSSVQLAGRGSGDAAKIQVIGTRLTLPGSNSTSPAVVVADNYLIVGPPRPAATPARVATTVKGWPTRPVLARAGRTAVKSVTLSLTATPARGRVGVVQSQSCRRVGARTVCTWAKYRAVRWPSAATGRASVLLTAVKGRSVTYRLVLPQTATAKAFVSRALVVRGA